MREWTDSYGRKWRLDMNLNTAMVIKGADMTAVYPDPVDLLSDAKFDPKILLEGMHNLGLVGMFAYCMAFDQCEEQKVSMDDFLSGINGETKASLREAVWDEVVNFIQGRGTSYSKLIQSFKETSRELETARQKGIDAMTEKMNSLLAGEVSKMDRELRTTLDQIGSPGQTSGDGRVSSASTGGR